MTMEKNIELLAVAEDWFERPMTDTKRKSITQIWVKSDLLKYSDEEAEEAFYQVIPYCSWNKQLLKQWLEKIESNRGKREMIRRSLRTYERINKRYALKDNSVKQIGKGE